LIIKYLNHLKRGKLLGLTNRTEVGSQNYFNLMSPKKLNLLDATNVVSTTKSINTTSNPLLSDNLNNIFDKLNQINKQEQTTNLKKIMIKQKTFKEDIRAYEGNDIYRNLAKRNKIVRI
jgi:hypothetical protein